MRELTTEELKIASDGVGISLAYMRTLTTEELKQVSGGVTFNPPGQPSFTLSGTDTAVTFTEEAGKFIFGPVAGLTVTHS
jgi:bacteriocin-like protein